MCFFTLLHMYIRKYCDEKIDFKILMDLYIFRLVNMKMWFLECHLYVYPCSASHKCLDRCIHVGCLRAYSSQIKMNILVPQIGALQTRHKTL